MAAEAPGRIVNAIRELDDEQRAEVAGLLLDGYKPGLSRRQLLGLGIFGVAGLGAATPTAAGAASRTAIEPAAAIERDGTVCVSPGDELQSKVDDAEPGAELVFESGEHDVAQMGTAVVNKPITVRMSGGQVANGQEGAVLVNTGDDAVAGPILEFANPSPGSFSSRYMNVGLYNLNIAHGGGGPALVFDDVLSAQLFKPFIDGKANADSLVELRNRADLFSMWGGHLRRPANDGIVDNGTGGSRGLFGTHIGGISGKAAGDGVRGGADWMIFGGQISGFATGFNLTDGRLRAYSPRFETVGAGVVFGSSTSRVQNSFINNPHFATVDDVCVEFGLSASNVISRPTNLPNGSDSGNAVRWSADSIRDKISGTYGALAGKSWDIDESAAKPTVQFDPLPVLTNIERGYINQPVEGMVFYNETDGNLNIRDPSGWILPDGSTT